MNAQKEVEYIAEIVKLKHELKKAHQIMSRGEWVSVADIKKCATVGFINYLLKLHFELNHDCDYKLMPPEIKRAELPRPLGSFEPISHVITKTPPELVVTRTVDVK